MSKLTKRVRVSFDLKIVMGQEELYKDLLDCMRQEKRDGRMDFVIRESLKGGLDDAAVALIKAGLPDVLREAFRDASGNGMELSISSISNRVIR